MGLSDNENISLLNEVCVITKIDEFLENIPEKLNYELGFSANKLSSCQRQRISIARAIISKPKILILDEATSAVDLETETHIYTEIKRFLPKSTLIIINHRKESLNFVDINFEL